MELSHFTTKPLKTIRNIKQVETRSCYSKPQGFWVSVDGENDWQEWCASEMSEWITPATKRYRIALADNANILSLPQDMGIGQFEAMFCVEKTVDRFKEQAIDWQKVAKQYDGIIIAPYQWEHRLSSDWYYPWDCASGCIWNPRAIESFTEMTRQAERLAA